MLIKVRYAAVISHMNRNRKEISMLIGGTQVFRHKSIRR